MELAFIIECDLDIDLLTQNAIKVQHKTSHTKFGDVIFSLIYKNNKGCIVFENGGMNNKYVLSDCSLPIFETFYKEKVKNLFLLGFAGSLKKIYPTNSFLIPSDFIDATKKRPVSFLEQISPGSLFFYRMADPFNSDLIKILEEKAINYTRISKNITLVVTEGPRFETSAEIRAYEKWGGDCVCMSGVPDAVFCRELNINYAMGLFVSNFAEGLEKKTIENVLEIAEPQTKTITKLIIDLIDHDYSAIDNSSHEKYWMQRPSREIFNKI